MNINSKYYALGKLKGREEVVREVMEMIERNREVLEVKGDPKFILNFLASWLNNKQGEIRK